MSYLTVKEVAARYVISTRTVWRKVREGALPPPVHLGRRTARWRLFDLEKWDETRARVERRGRK